MHHGVIPEGMIVLHSCDNRACVNPAHIRAGTYKDNQADAIQRGRWTRGEKQHKAVLNAEKVRAIRARHKETGWGSKRLGREFGVAHGTIDAILSGQTWKHVR